MTEIDPITAVRATMPSGVRASCRAAAAGIINIAAIKSIPTTFIETATVIPNDNVRISCSRFGLVPAA